MYAQDNMVMLPKWIDKVVWIWALLVISADLKVTVYSHIHWVITGIALLLLVPYLRHVKIHIVRSSLFSASLLVLSVLLSAIHSPHLFYDLGQAAKLLVILVGAMIFFTSLTNYAHTAVKAFVASAYFNTVLLLLGSTILPKLVVWTQYHIRHGTFLNLPGSLWRAGIIIFIYAAYLAFTSRCRKLWHILLLISSILLVFIDGSRTGFIVLVLGLVYLVIILVLDKRISGKSIVITLLIIFITGSAIVYMRPSLTLRFLMNSTGVQRFISLIQETAEKGPAGLSAEDPNRFNMLRDVLQAIKFHPLLGTGIGTTRTFVPSRGGPEVVHISYLQVWADLGLLGFIAFVWFVLGWVIRLPDLFRRIRELPDISDRALYYNAIFMLIFYAVTGLFHPLSTEWSEWITFIIPYALIAEVLQMQQPKEE